MHGMTVDVVRASDLGECEVKDWLRLLSDVPYLTSPFFHHEFTRAVALARDDVRIAIATSSGQIRAILPFHQKAFGVAAPIGGQMSDYQGAIGAAEIDLAALLSKAGVSAYDFNHGLSRQRSLTDNAYLHTSSPLIDLRAGFDSWLRNRKATGSGDIKNTERKARKLAREHGPLRLILNERSPSAWTSFLGWKSGALRELNVKPMTEIAWMMKALETLRMVDKTGFSGMLSCLYAGDRLASIHFGLRTGSVIHWWFPTYDPMLSPYSPGLILLYEMAKAAPGTGCETIDLGRGQERYKRSFANSFTSICEGSVAAPGSLVGFARRSRVALQRAANAHLPQPIADLCRRGGTRILDAGLLH